MIRLRLFNKGKNMRYLRIVFVAFVLVLPMACSSSDGPAAPITDPKVPPPMLIDTIDSISVQVGTLATSMPSTVVAKWATGSTQSSLSALGKATILIPQGYTGDVTVSILGDMDNYPSLRTLTSKEYAQRSVNFALCPRRYGGYEIVLADLIQSPALSDPRPYLPIMKNIVDGTAAAKWDFFMWQPSELPLTVAFDTNLSLPHNPNDSIMIFKALDEVNRILGKQYFVPAVYSGAKVRIVLKNSSTYGVSGGATMMFATSTLQNGIITVANIDLLRNIYLNASNGEAVINQIFQNEGMHVLGAGHSICAWNGTMASSNSECRNSVSFSVTPKEAAMFHFMEAYWAKKQEMNAPYSYVEAFNGHRVLEQQREIFNPVLSPSTPFFALPALK